MESSAVPDLELRHLRYFVATAESGGVSAAADACRITQPALSRQLRGLETRLGVDLFDRVGGRLRLTASGHALLPLARDLLQRAEAFGTAARMRAAGAMEQVTIAAPTTTLTDVVSPFVAALPAEAPTPYVRAADGGDPAEALAAGADLVLTVQVPPAGVASRVLGDLPVLAYVPPGHPWADRGEVAVADLAATETLVLPAAASSRRALERAYEVEGLAPRHATEASNGTIAQALAAAGRGVAVVSDDPRYDLVPLGVHTASGAPVAFRLYCVWNADHPGRTVIADLAQALAGWTRTHYDPVRGRRGSATPGR